MLVFCYPKRILFSDELLGNTPVYRMASHKRYRLAEGADVSCTPPMYSSSLDFPVSEFFFLGKVQFGQLYLTV